MRGIRLLKMHGEIAGPAGRKSGFSIIETLVAVAIIGIATTMAIPLYQVYTIRAQVAQALLLSAPHKRAISEHHHDTGSFPNDNAAAQLKPPLAYAGKFVESIAVTGPVVEIVFGNEANPLITGRRLTLTADAMEGSVSWTCTSGGAIQDDHLPPTCR